MPAGYTRQAAAQIQPGLRANAEDVDAEYDALARAFDNAAGHDHSGSVAGDGAKISLTAGVVGVLPIANGGTGSSGGTAPVFANAQFNPGGVLIGAAGSIPGAGQLTLNANSSTPPAGGGGNLYVVGANSTNPVIELDAFTGAGTIAGRQARGTAAFPSATLNGDWLLALDGIGYTGSAYRQGAQVLLQANENWSAGAGGTALQFWTTPNGTTGAVNSLILAGNFATFPGAVTTGSNLTVNGGLTVSSGATVNNGLTVNTGGLQVNGSVTSAGGSAGFTANARDGTANWLFYANNNAARLWMSSGDKLVVDANGNLTVPGALNFQGIQLLYLPGSPGWVQASTGQGFYTSYAVQSAIGAGQTAFYAPNGNIVIGGTVTSASDARLKENIADSGIGLDAVMRLAPKTFNRIALPGREEFGLIAQDVQAVLPQAVSVCELAEDDMLGINYAVVTTALVGAVQELHVLLKALEAKCSTPA